MPVDIPGSGVRISSTYRAQNFPEIRFADGRTLVPQTDGGSATTASLRGLGKSISNAINTLAGKEDELTPLQEKQLDLQERRVNLEEKRLGISEKDVDSRIASRAADSSMKKREANLQSQSADLQKQRFDLEERMSLAKDDNEKQKIAQEQKKLDLAERRLNKEIEAFQKASKKMGDVKVGDIVDTQAGKREVSSVNKDGTIRSLKALPASEVEAEADAKKSKARRVRKLEDQIADLSAKEAELQSDIAAGGDKFGPDIFLNPFGSRTKDLKSTQAEKSSLESALEREIGGKKSKPSSKPKIKLPSVNKFKEGTVIRKDGNAWRLNKGQWEPING